MARADDVGSSTRSDFRCGARNSAGWAVRDGFFTVSWSGGPDSGLHNDRVEPDVVAQSRANTLSTSNGWRAGRRVALLVGVALICQSAFTLAADAAPVQDKKKSAPIEIVDSRPDAVSAMVTARAQGQRVENEAARTERTSLFANPDGTVTEERHEQPIRYKDKGAWRDVDLSFKTAADGSVAPRGHKRGLRLSGKTSKATDELITVSAGKDREVAFGSLRKLPAPVIEGSTATYPDIAPGGVDLVLDSRRSGFEQNYVIRERPTGPMSWDIPLRTKGLTVRPEADGSISFVDDKDVVASTIPAATAWDAVVDPRTRDRVNTSPVALTVVQKGKNKAILTVTPDPAWLTDPARILPIVVDPTYATTSVDPAFDAFVQQGYATDQSTTTELKLGNNGAGQIARSFIRFPASPVQGKTIISAKLNLYETHSWSCSARAWDVWETNSPGSSVTWSDQPTWKSKVASTTATKGYSSSCANGWVTQDITNLVANDWAPNTTTTNSIGIRAADESDEYGYKKFSSSETSNDPYISVTYSRPPGGTSAPTMTPVAAYAPPGGASALYTGTRTPMFSATATDPDGNALTMNFEVHTSATMTAANQAGECTSVKVASGSAAKCAPPALPDNDTYWVRAKATDEVGAVATAWSPMLSFKVGAAVPAAPSISCPAPYANGSWQNNPPAAQVTCTVATSGTGPNAPGYVVVGVQGFGDDWTERTYLIPPGGSYTQLKVSAGAGAHAILARSQTPAGTLSGYAPTYQFGYGVTALSSPAIAPRTTTTGVVPIAGAGPPKGASVMPTATLKWRVAGSGADAATGWTDVAAGAAPLTVGDANGTAGVSVTGSWDTYATVAGTASLNERQPVLLETQLCLAYTNAVGTQCTWGLQPIAVQYVPHAFGNGFPTADAGPGQVALWTGEFNTDTTDVSVPGYTGALSISRSHSTFAGTPNAAGAVFGPGWTAALDGSDAGVAGAQVIDSTRVDGTIALIDTDGSALVYATPNGMRRTGADLPTGTYVPANTDTALDASTLTVSGSGAATLIKLTQDDGTVTTFAVTGAPTATSDAVAVPSAVTEAGVAGQTSYSRDAAGRITRIIAAAPPGVTCTVPNDPSVALLTKGCRSLRLDYATTTTGGEVAGQVKGIWLDIYDPLTAGGKSFQVAAYTYDSAGRLATVKDPRSNLTTAYGYDSTSTRLKTITPPGLDPVTLTYSTSPDVKLTSTTRPRPAGGTATLASFVYGTPLSGSGLPTMTAAGVAAWNQPKVPTYAAAVFGPDHPAPASPGPADWP